MALLLLAAHVSHGKRSLFIERKLNYNDGMANVRSVSGLLLHCRTEITCTSTMEHVTVDNNTLDLTAPSRLRPLRTTPQRPATAAAHLPTYFPL